HGNGTEAIFWDDPAVAYVSTHESPFYPGTGAASDTGGAGAPGTGWNFELPAGATGDAALAAPVAAVAPPMASVAPTFQLRSRALRGAPHPPGPAAWPALAGTAAPPPPAARRARALAPAPAAPPLSPPRSPPHSPPDAPASPPDAPASPPDAPASPPDAVA